MFTLCVYILYQTTRSDSVKVLKRLNNELQNRCVEGKYFDIKYTCTCTCFPENLHVLCNDIIKELLYVLEILLFDRIVCH